MGPLGEGRENWSVRRGATGPLLSSRPDSPTMPWSCPAIWPSSSAALLVSLALPAMPRAAWATLVTFWAMSALPLAASALLRAISLVVAVCSSTAPALLPPLGPGGKPPPRPARARGLDGGGERQEVRLVGDRGDDLDPLADLG